MLERIIIILLLIFGFLTLRVSAQTSYLTEIVSQRYEGGEMIFRRDNGSIYVLNYTMGQWELFTSQEYGALPLNPYTNPPAYRYEPLNGFGRIWGNNTAIRRQLGWAVTREVGFELRFTELADGRKYYERYGGLIAELLPNGTFNFVSEIPQPQGALVHVAMASRVVARGDVVDISWVVTGGEFVIIYMNDTANLTSAPIANFEQLPLNGSLQWRIPENAPEEVTVTVWAAKRSQSSRFTSIYEYIASNNAVIDVVADSDLRIETGAAYQAYERGFMIWRADTGEIRVFYRAGSTWELFPQHVYEGFSDFNGEVPANCVKPINGFGRVWGAYPEVASALGCAISAEVGYTLNIRSDPWAVFTYTLPNGTSITINRDSWQR